MDIKKEYERWLVNATADTDVADELKTLDDTKIEDAFYRDLAFGTGGLRGVIGAGTNRMNVYTVAKASQGLADYLKKNFTEPSVAIGYDSRIKSDVFAKTTAGVFAANGIKVNIWPVLMPVPTVSFATRYLHTSAGVMVTASHNPSKYNGYKVYGADGCQITTEAAAEILAEIEKLDIFQESSNVTYRVYDYDRVDKNGKKRELHFDKAVQVMDMNVELDVRQKPRMVKYYSGCSRELLCRCKYFETERIQVTKGFAFSVMDSSFQILMCLNGYGEVQTMDAEQKPMRFSKGETLFLPAGLGRCLVVGDAEMIKVRC